MLIVICAFPKDIFAQELQVVRGEWSNSIGFSSQTVPERGLLSQNVSNDASLQKLAADIEKALLQRKTTFTVTYSGDFTNTRSKVLQAFKSVFLKNEYLNYDFRGYRFVASGYKGNATIKFNVGYYQTANQIKFVQQKVDKILRKILTNRMNDHEKIKAIHDYIVLNVQYDTSYNQAINAPYFALSNGKTLCNGYAMLTYDMLKKAGIPVRLISGTSKGIGHAWNLVRLDGRWYHLDVTWDDPVPDQAGRLRYDYYLLPDKLIKKDHFWKTGGLNGFEQPYPIANTDYANLLLQSKMDKLVNSLHLQYLKPEFTSHTDTEFVQFVSKHFHNKEVKFSFRFVTNTNNIQDKLRTLIRTAASQEKVTTSMQYNWEEYTRTEAQDYIVTILMVR